MPSLTVNEQVHLSTKQLLDISVASIVYRLTRSLVTMAIIVLAIAFLAHIMMDNCLGRATRDTVRSRAQQLDATSRFLGQLGNVGADEQLVAAFAAVRKGSAEERNLQRWGNFTPDETRHFVEFSRTTGNYEAFFDALAIGRRALLVQQQQGLAVFDWLAQPEHFQSFTNQIHQMVSVRVPGGSEPFRQFLQDWPAYRRQLIAVRAAYAQTVDRVAADCGPAGLAGALSSAVTAGRTTKFFDKLETLGFTVDRQEVPDIIRGIEHEQQMHWALSQLNVAPIRAGWGREFQESFSPSQALLSCAAAPSRIDWVARTLAAAGLSQGFDPVKFHTIASEYQAREHIRQASRDLVSRYGTEVQMNSRSWWLIVVSFAVCVVGIANAMLMSVLERFKEIATMKCLGARNQTIAFLFVTESIIIGISGGLLGTGLGLLIVIGRQTVAYGSLLFVHFPWGDVLGSLAACFGCSLLLAAIAAIYPATVAARMAPMEAMRVE